MARPERGSLVFEDIRISGPPGCRAEVTFVYSVGAWQHLSTMRWRGFRLDEDAAGVRACLLHIGLCLLLWPYMAKPRGKIRVGPRAGRLTEAQRRWWQELYKDWLLEFAYCNGLGAALEPEVLAEAPEEEEEAVRRGGRPDCLGVDPGKGLCGLGGGKDSLVAMKLLSEQLPGSRGGPPGAATTWFYSAADSHEEIDGSAVLQGILRTSGMDLVAVSHDPDYRGLRAATEPGLRFGCVGGPVVQLIAFDAVLAALCGGYSYLAVGNERSANFGNGMAFKGVDVNHQWDKGLQFENRLNSYVDANLLGGFKYFSPLATLWEVQIAGYFACECRDYFATFCSCNSYSGDEWAGTWCGTCAKCCFVYILLSAWCSPDDVRAVFGGRDLFGTYGPTHHVQTLAGDSHHGAKPLDCVGTPEEARASLRCAAAQFSGAGVPMPWALRVSEGSWRHGDMAGLIRDFAGERPRGTPAWFSWDVVHARILGLLLPLVAAAGPPCGEEDDGSDPDGFGFFLCDDWAEEA